MTGPIIFFLGATGYLGGEVLQLLAKDLPNYTIVALVRNITDEKKRQLDQLHPALFPVEGTLNDDATIQELASKADIVINVASSDHHAAVVSILAGLDTRIKAKPAVPPIYIHISGVGVTSDNSRGELLLPKRVWTDMSMDYNQLDGVTHIESDRAIIAAGSRKDNPIRSMIICPSWIYGVSTGLKKLTMPLRMYARFAVELGVAGTWGRGKNVMPEIHVKDVAAAVLLVLKAALENKAFEGTEGIYFATHPRMTSMHDINHTIGDVLFANKLVKEPGCKPLTPAITDTLGEFGWSLLAGNLWAAGERLALLGWEPKYTNQITLLDSLQELQFFVSRSESVRAPDFSGAVM